MQKLIVAATFLALIGVAVASTLNPQSAFRPRTSARGAPGAVSPPPVFLTPQPLMNVNYGYGREHPGRGHAHGHGR